MWAESSTAARSVFDEKGRKLGLSRLNNTSAEIAIAPFSCAYSSRALPSRVLPTPGRLVNDELSVRSNAVVDVEEGSPIRPPDREGIFLQ